MFEDRAARDCYRRGVRDALEAGVIHRSPGIALALQQWLADLDAWSDGEPPVAPHHWPAAVASD